MERRGWDPSAFRVSFIDTTYKLRMINRKFKSCFSISAIFFIIIGTIFIVKFSGYYYKYAVKIKMLDNVARSPIFSELKSTIDG